jgi:hypothetical protein
MEMKYKKSDLKKGAKIEAEEHPSFTAFQTRKIARQHLMKHPLYYSLEPVFEKMLKQREKRKRK